MMPSSKEGKTSMEVGVLGMAESRLGSGVV